MLSSRLYLPEERERSALGGLAARRAFQLGVGTEAQVLRGFDLDGIAGARINTLARLALGDIEGAEVSDIIGIDRAFLQTFETVFNLAEYAFDNAFGFCFADLLLGGDVVDQICFAHVFLSRM